MEALRCGEVYAAIRYAARSLAAAEGGEGEVHGDYVPLRRKTVIIRLDNMAKHGVYSL